LNKEEARSLLDEELANLRRQPYSVLVETLLGCDDIVEKRGPSGTTYYLEPTACWDDKKKGHLRVSISIDDGGWRAFVPFTDDFIIAPDGRFIGE
jgi:hypothetical protein